MLPKIFPAVTYYVDFRFHSVPHPLFEKRRFAEGVAIHKIRLQRKKRFKDN